MTEDTESETQAQAETESPVETAAAKDVPVSPYGFGPYPEIPEDYPSKNLIDWSTDGPSLELIWRVLIKLWTEGERNFRGGSTYKGKILPHYNDVVYVRWSEYRKSDGTIVRRAAGKRSGPQVNYSGIDFFNPPAHIRVLDIETSGIDPYEYLDLFQEKEQNNEE